MRGHITKRSKSSWSIVLDLGRDPPTGKRKQQWVAVKGTKKEAERRLAELLHQKDTGSYIKPAKLTVGEFLHQWVQDHRLKVRSRTFEEYAATIERHLVPNLGAIPLMQLTAQQIQKYYTKALISGRKDGTGGLSARTVLHHHRILSEALSYAVRMGMVTRNVAQLVDAPRPVNRQMTALDVGDVERFLAAAEGTPYHALFHLDIHTGLRRSELLGLRWSDVDLDLLTLTVAQVMHKLKDGRVVFEEPKTEKGRRTIALTPASALALREHQGRQRTTSAAVGLGLKDDDPIFASPGALPPMPNSVSRAFRKIARAAGLATISLHGLRHTHASLMLRAGVPMKVVQERLGHATMAITADIYTHVFPDLHQDAARRFEEVLNGAR